MYMTFIVLDTETCYDHIIQLCWYVLDDQYTILERNCHYIKPDGFYINNSEIHGITHLEATMKGVSLLVAITSFQKSLEKHHPRLLVAHNMSFDIGKITRAYQRLKKDTTFLQSIPTYCTMKKAKNILNLKNKLGRSKNPKLNETYNYFNHRNLNLELEDAHNAIYDVLYTCDVFKKLHRMETICNQITNYD